MAEENEVAEEIVIEAPEEEAPKEEKKGSFFRRD